ncbi:MAG: SDR family oxidoreductase [Halieaceae bacterium]|jgi:NAD(P)-dependent dehydrogenase (short-subunit alcohol dehydrogenase family)|uniref:SDR family oxidoreductase n=1 Tax=Candidatus Seongchinamella marina TaxID=2518990 RepID=A0ABT3SWU4_9GAMM|nr:SDR family NAD(P)-dependent oxidoreductase [Candidatus Seongchinamella marina]MBT5007373.1 SDR family oxidoreductase [Halieaceae bacterium]MBT6126574.1 SDR family oxidoreductase [Halieaceae bacterium]MBT7720204.1 SDR family oxidoreductase [Halieaceae bacterium]MCX2974090.1 SDR family oxidoreductase [Candidatus Seongchinamella marina]
MSNTQGLSGKVALITGAARHRGIGRAIALRLAEDGADIVICGRPRSPESYPAHEQEMKWRGVDSLAQEIEGKGRQALALECDVTNKDQVVAMVETIKARFGRLDIIVNNAGVPSDAGASPILDTGEDVWYQTMDVNVNGVFLVSKYGGRLIRDSGNGGAIVMIASLAGRVGLQDYGAYCASKFGVIGFTQQLALELAKTGIRVNCVSPGSHDTDMMDGTIARATELYQLPDGAFKQQLEEFIPMGRQGKVSELASVVSFMCSQDASYVTGQTINVDGGARLD